MGTSSPFAGAGELRAAYDAVDWASTSIGAPETWSTTLRQALDLSFGTGFGIMIAWGPELVMLYNAGYVPLIGDKHPAALGSTVREVFPESWEQLAPLFDDALAGRSVDFEGMPLMMQRRGFLEETYWTFSYSPVRGDDGAVHGVMDITTEATRQVIDHRRLELLNRLGDLATDLDAAADLPQRALSLLGTVPLDLPAADLQLTDPQHRPATARALPPPPEPLRRRQVLVADGGAGDGGGAGGGGRLAWVRVPGAPGGEDFGVLAVRLSDHLPLDATYLDFLRLIASTVGDALSVVTSYEAEKHRADLQAWQARRLSGLVAVASALPDAEDEEGVLAVLTGGAASLLGADGVVLGVVIDGTPGASGVPGGGDPALPRTAVPALAVLGDELDPAADVLPAAVAGTPVVSAAEFPGTAVAWPLRLADRTVGALGLSWREPRPISPEDRDLLTALAASTAQAVDRVAARRAEREAADAVRSLAETLQRSLLTSAPRPEHLDIAVRYLPAAEHAQVGGDWHDAFLTASGTACLVIGDVTGHDQDAAAAMGQVRNLLRGIGYSLEVSPAAALAALDRAMRDLGVGALATGVLATVEPLETAGTWRLRWSNAGHMPPLVVSPDGGVELLRTSPDLLLGLDADAVRADHVHGLPAGATVLLYTDGLVERRGASIDEGLSWLAQTAAEFAALGPAELCDAVLGMVGGHAEDDVAVLAVRVRPEPVIVVGLS